MRGGDVGFDGSSTVYPHAGRLQWCVLFVLVLLALKLLAQQLISQLTGCCSIKKLKE